MKKLFSGFLVLSLMTSSSVYAANITPKVELEKSGKAIDSILKSENKLSVDNAMKLAEIKVIKEPIYAEKLKALEKIKEENIEKYGDPIRKVDENGNVYYKYPKGEPSYNLVQEIIDLEDTLESSVDDVRKNTRLLYMNIVEAKQNIEITKSKMDIAKEELEKEKLKYSMGVVIKSDIAMIEANLATAINNYENSKIKLNILYDKFEMATDISKNYLVNKEDLTFDISSLLSNVSENIVDDYVVPTNLDKKTMEKYKLLADLKKELEDKETALEKVAGGYSEDSIFYYNKSEELGIENLKEKITDTERDLTIEFSGDSEKIKNSIDSFQNIKNGLELNKKKYEQSVIKYKNGQIKKHDFLNSKLIYDESKLQYENSLSELYILVDNFNSKYNLEEEEK